VAGDLDGAVLILAPNWGGDGAVLILAPNWGGDIDGLQEVGVSRLHEERS
jgi:hypothetical protein